MEEFWNLGILISLLLVLCVCWATREIRRADTFRVIFGFEHRIARKYNRCSIEGREKVQSKIDELRQADYIAWQVLEGTKLESLTSASGKEARRARARLVRATSLAKDYGYSRESKKRHVVALP